MSVWQCVGNIVRSANNASAVGYSISGGVVALNQFPDQYDKLRVDPMLIPNMVAEMIRLQTPVIHMRRTALKDFVLVGKQIKEGDKVELRVLWEEITQRFEKVELVGDVVRLPNNFIRGIAEVPVRLIPKRQQAAKLKAKQ